MAASTTSGLSISMNGLRIGVECAIKSLRFAAKQRYIELYAAGPHL
jgi:hypothetical protein